MYVVNNTNDNDNNISTSLTHYYLSDQGISHPLVTVPGGGAPWNPQRNQFSLQNCLLNAMLYIYILKWTIFKQNKSKKWFSVSKWRSNFDFCFVSFRFWRKFEKPLSKRNFKWNLAHNWRLWIYSHYYLKMGNIYFSGILRAKQFFADPLNANLC